MTTTTIAPNADTVSDTRESIAAYQAFYDTVNGYKEPERPSAGYIAAVRDSVASQLAVPLAQLEYDTDGLAGLTEGRTFRVGVSPGIISCRSTDYSGKETTRNAEPERRSAAVDMLNAFQVDLDTGEISDEVPDLDGPSKAEITGWSRKSRANMSRTLASLDYSDWLQEEGALCMVTLTLPGDWLAIAPDGKTFKALLEVFRRRWVRAIGPWRLLWKLEFQRRGAPHWHALARVPAMVGAQTFEAWLARTWADVAGASKDIDGVDKWGRADSEYLRHIRAHEHDAVDFSGKDFSDPRRIALYFAGHSAKTQDGKEYQHIVPEEWQAPGKGPGRFWGFCGLKRAFVELEVTQRDYDRLRREMRKLARARAWEIAVKRSRGAVPVPLVRAPKLRRSMHGGGGGQNGGWVLLNDAVPVVRALAGWLATANNGTWDGLIEPSHVGAPKRFRQSEPLARFVWDSRWSQLTLPAHSRSCRVAS